MTLVIQVQECAPERNDHHGELLIDLLVVDAVEFIVMACLGFMPLGVIHWADKRRKFRRETLAGPRRAVVPLVALKASLFVMLTNWSANLPL